MTTPDGQGRLGAAMMTLIRRAAVDEAFLQRLLAERSDAATEIGVELHPAEKQLLDSYPENLLGSMVENMPVPDCERRVFLKAASVAVAATISAGLVGTGSAAPKGTAKADGKAVSEDALLAKLKAAESKIEAVRKELQKESAKAAARVSKRLSEQELVPQLRPMCIAGIMPRQKTRPRQKTPQERARDEQELERIRALETMLVEIQAEAEAALIEAQLKARSLNQK